MIDLRSDTVTRPSAEMRRRMAEADVGDDVYGEDPTVNRLEITVAALLGKAAGLFVPSGVMANQIALWALGEPGSEILVSQGAHCLHYESGAASALSGLALREVGDAHGVVLAADLDVRPNNSHYPQTRALALENTHNRAGGRLLPDATAVATRARELGLGVHLDGARLWNAAAATGKTERELAAPFDSVSVCLSKGLGAPVGSVLCGTETLVERGRRRRKQLGGGMRQAGILAAGALFALEHHRTRLVDDHRRARALAAALQGLPGVVVGEVQTNIVMADLSPEHPLDVAAVIARAKEAGLLVGAMGPRRVRAVTHLDVGDEDCVEAAKKLRAALTA